MRHVHGGSILLERLERDGIGDEYLEISEVLCDGPTPADVEAAGWLDLRAAHLATLGDDGDAAEIRGALADTDAALDRWLDEDREEIVLWFGWELFCQSILVRLLARLAARTHRPPLSLISPDGDAEHPGCTVSTRAGDELRRALAARVPVGPAHLALAARVWKAWTAPAPDSLRRLLASADFTPLPHLRAAVERLLEELPDDAGLARSEREVLAALANGAESLGEVMNAANGMEERQWMTDLLVIDRLRRLAAADPPLVRWDADEGVGAITDAGRAVLEGRARHRTAERWVGGTRVSPPPP